MSSKVDMSLDDIISKNKSNRGRGGRGRGRGGRGAVSSRGTSAGRGAGRGARSRGRVMRNTRGRRSGPFGNSGFNNNSINGRWSHDMYYGGTGSISSMKTSSGPAKLNITNLEYGVSDSDIKELFCEFGNMRSATVHYDRTGRSLGSAQVVFERRQDAMKAIQQYNGVHLDGRPMHIEMDGQSGGGGFTNGSSPVKRLQAGPRPAGGRGGTRGTPRRFGRGGRGTTRGGASRGGTGRGRFGRGRGGRGRGAKATKVPTAEELDAELDDYVMQASN